MAFCFASPSQAAKERKRRRISRNIMRAALPSKHAKRVLAVFINVTVGRVFVVAFYDEGMRIGVS